VFVGLALLAGAADSLLGGLEFLFELGDTVAALGFSCL
jgi:hypothetical protein